MDVAQLLIGDAVVEREIELADGSKHVLYFRELPNTAFERHAIWASSKDEAVQASAAPKLIAMALVNSDGSPALTPEQAERLKRPVMIRILHAVFEVNGMTKKKETPAGNASAPETPSGSGTS